MMKQFRFILLLVITHFLSHTADKTQHTNTGLCYYTRLAAACCAKNCINASCTTCNTVAALGCCPVAYTCKCVGYCQYLSSCKKSPSSSTSPETSSSRKWYDVHGSHEYCRYGNFLMVVFPLCSTHTQMRILRSEHNPSCANEACLLMPSSSMDNRQEADAQHIKAPCVQGKFHIIEKIDTWGKIHDEKNPALQEMK